MSNYVDPGTIDNILNKRRKNRLPSGKPPKASRDEPQNNEHLERIAKMKELYGLFVKMEEN